MDPIPLLLLLIFFVQSSAAATAANNRSSTVVDLFPLGLGKKTTHLHFFFHDTVIGPHPSVTNVTVTRNPGGFGSVFMFDDALTEGPDPSSRELGRAQGFYAIASQAGEEFALVMTMNLVFAGGSSLAVVGRNNVFSRARELPVVGGSGRFRMARGYALLHTRSIDTSTNNAVVEYDVYVQHYGPAGAGAGSGTVVRESVEGAMHAAGAPVGRKLGAGGLVFSLYFLFSLLV